MRLFATAAKGTEGALRDELRELRFRGVRADRGGVHLEGDLPTALAACLWSRIAARVLVELGTFPAPDGDALYEGVRGVDWDAWLTPKDTLAVRAASRKSQLTHTQFVAQRTKDAIVDAVRDRRGARPSVDRDAPDLLLFVHVVGDRATLYVDASGASLHERGYRPRGSSEHAPLRETLAAALLRLSGWDRRSPLVDPMCGTGTLGVEAAAWAAGVPPGAHRARFGVEGFRVATEVDRAAFHELREEAREAAREGRRAAAAPIFLRDVDPRALEMTEASARAAGVEVRIERGSVADAAVARAPGLLLTNPPYGERLPMGDAVHALGGAIRARLPRPAGVLAGSPEVARALDLREEKWLGVFNGDLECRLLLFGDPAAQSAEAASPAPRSRGAR